MLFNLSFEYGRLRYGTFPQTIRRYLSLRFTTARTYNKRELCGSPDFLLFSTDKAYFSDSCVMI